MYLKDRNQKISLLLIVVLVIVLTACGTNQPEQPGSDLVSTTLRLSAAIETNADQETSAFLMVSNPGKMLFPAKDNFDAEMTLWTAGGEPRARIEAHTIQAISPDETIQLASSSWKLDPGVYFLTWGSPEYGGNVTIFSIVEDAGRIYRANSVSFSTKPPEYNIQASSAGRIRSFSVEADGTLIITGETPVPDTHCVFPILFDGTGVVEGFPVGTCAQIAEGQWQMTHPTDPSGIKVQVKKDTSYQVIVFCEDLTLPPSEPFAVHISPPPQN